MSISKGIKNLVHIDCLDIGELHKYENFYMQQIKKDDFNYYSSFKKKDSWVQNYKKPSARFKKIRK